VAITRTPIINDDGTCTTGTTFDNPWKQEFYDQIDAMALEVQRPMNIGPAWYGGAPGGQIDNWNLGSLGKYTAYFIAPVANLLVTGIVQQASSTMYLLVNTSAFTMTLGWYHSGSTPFNRFFAPDNANVVLGPWHSVWILYDGQNGAWVALKP